MLLMAIQIYLTRGRKKDASHTSFMRYLPWIIVTLMIVLNIVMIHEYKKRYGLAMALPKATKTGTDNVANNSSAHGSTTIQIYNTKPQSTAATVEASSAQTTTDDVAA